MANVPNPEESEAEVALLEKKEISMERMWFQWLLSVLEAGDFEL